MAFVSGVTVTKSSFHGSRVCARVPKSGTTVTMKASASVPFLDSVKTLDPDAPAFADFDPLGFSSMYDLKFLQEAEIKHGRICMLAVLGWVFPEFLHLPADVFSNTNPLAAFNQVPKAGLIQILLFVAACEAISFEKIYYTENWKPGVYGFDPLNLGKTEKSLKWYSAAEIKNGRLAMIAIGGFIHQSLLTKLGVIAQLKAGLFTPTGYPVS